MRTLNFKSSVNPHLTADHPPFPLFPHSGVFDLLGESTEVKEKVPVRPELPGRGKTGFERWGAGGVSGFTLLEVLVATAILGIAITVVLQLFSANLRAISLSGDYVSAATMAEAKMREILNNDKLAENSFSETTVDGYRIDVSVRDVLNERTESLQVKMFEIDLTVQWMRGLKQRSLTLKTMKVMKKEV